MVPCALHLLLLNHAEGPIILASGKAKEQSVFTGKERVWAWEVQKAGEECGNQWSEGELGWEL